VECRFPALHELRATRVMGCLRIPHHGFSGASPHDRLRHQARRSHGPVALRRRDTHVLPHALRRRGAVRFRPPHLRRNQGTFERALQPGRLLVDPVHQLHREHRAVGPRHFHIIERAPSPTSSAKFSVSIQLGICPIFAVLPASPASFRHERNGIGTTSVSSSRPGRSLTGLHFAPFLIILFALNSTGSTSSAGSCGTTKMVRLPSPSACSRHYRRIARARCSMFSARTIHTARAKGVRVLGDHPPWSRTAIRYYGPRPHSRPHYRLLHHQNLRHPRSVTPL
jgi:hypothetical protein